MKLPQLKNVIFAWVLPLAFLAICVIADGPRGAFADSTSSSLSPSAQQDKSIELFHEIFEISLENDKPANLDRITALFQQIINSCPDAPLAQESHWRLIESFFIDYQPPQTEEALLLYEQFVNRYPNSPLINVTKYTMAQGLYVNKFWDDLLNLELSVVTEFFATGKLNSPLPLFYYSEAHFHLSEIKESIKGYQALLDHFPDTRLAQMAAKKLAQITQDP